MKRHIIYFILLFTLLYFSSCTVVFPIVASQKYTPNYNEIFDINKIYKNQIIKVITTDYDLIEGEVIKKDIFDTPEYVDVSKIISDANRHFFPEVGDTLTFETMTTKCQGVYQFFDFYNIYVIDESNNLKAIKIKSIDYMTAKNREFDLFTINRFIKSAIPYELVILQKEKKIHIPSSKVFKIQRMKFPTYVPMAFMAGCSVDVVIWIIFLLNIAVPSG